ncbi:hypothetical protein [Acetobacter senegalensis]|uniref:hypothetical protein n=1 Tax=Acetobacter senegalensis TaxID=446692 RepID=UPI00264F6EB1|nr:hypothetical protein [Acetobacter senegalensis]MDN7352148.1 hypothetical protein [Acetobacter senegalensis]
MINLSGDVSQLLDELMEILILQRLTAFCCYQILSGGDRDGWVREGLVILSHNVERRLATLVEKVARV